MRSFVKVPADALTVGIQLAIAALVRRRHVLRHACRNKKRRALRHASS